MTAEKIPATIVAIATHVANILTGGDVTPGSLMSEQHMLDMEREAFLSLCGEPRTQDRMAFPKDRQATSELAWQRNQYAKHR